MANETKQDHSSDPKRQQGGGKGDPRAGEGGGSEGLPDAVDDNQDDLGRDVNDPGRTANDINKKM
ncbi:MAG TPA: hypothetical protein VFE52_01900 [Devosia sp.]|jgi:hypothetical protein|nr:hypothetical protein [Devosia sp.]